MDLPSRATNRSCHAAARSRGGSGDCGGVCLRREMGGGGRTPPPTSPPSEMSLGRERTGEVLQVSLGEKGRERCHGGRERERVGEVRETANPNSWYRYKPGSSLGYGLG